MKCERNASTIVSRFDRVFNFVIVEILKFHKQIREILIPKFEGLELVSKEVSEEKFLDRRYCTGIRFESLLSL